MAATTPHHPVWWGETTLAEEVTAYWRIGPFAFWLRHSAHEWRFACDAGDDGQDGSLQREIPATGEMPEDGSGTRRLGFRHASPTLRLLPALADRPAVVQPSSPFSLPPQEELTLHISTPLWLRIAVGEPLVDFVEMPLHRPSDTWFGPNTREGELCYALRTNARLRREDLQVRPHRALTALRVSNLADTRLAVQKIQLPLPHMSLFASADGELWTETVTLERRDDGELAELELSKDPPAHLRDPQRLSEPRERASRGLLIRAFGGLIGSGRQS